MPQDDDLTARAVELHRAMVVQGSSIFLPTGGAFLAITGEQMQQIKDGTPGDTATGQVAADDFWHVYAEWHEAVHMSQMVTCPYVRDAAWHLLGLTKVATLKESNPTPDGTPWPELGDDYEQTIKKLEAPAGDEITAWHIIETHAVVQGLRWLTGSSEQGCLRRLADHLYCKRDPRYMLLVDEVANSLGEETAITLLPRLCFLSLQTKAPHTYFKGWHTKLITEGSAAALAACSPREFCKWAGVDPVFVSRSLREREPNLDNHPCMPLFRRYFDRFEAVPDVESRLDLLLNPNGIAARETFWPTFTVFADGHVTLALSTGSDIDDEEKLFWVSTTADAMAGLELLAQHTQ